MKKKIITLIFISILAGSSLCACGSSSQDSTKAGEQAVKAAAETETESKSAAEEADAYYEAGCAYLYGLKGQEINREAALINFQQALEKGKAEANLYLGMLCDWYDCPEYDYAKATAHYEAAGDNPYAQLSIGFLYYYGQGVEKDTVKAQELFDGVIAGGCVEGYYGSATVAWDERDYAAAFEYLNKAAEGQEQLFTAAAMNDIGWFYLSGKVEQDYGKAVEWYEKAADLGNVAAVHQLGELYQHGEGVEQDYGKALECYEKAVNLGNTDTMKRIGYMYENGLGVAQDSAKAKEWYAKAEAAK